MKTARQFSRVGPCLMLGELVTQTDTRIFYRLRDGKTAWAMKSSKLLVHLEPCPSWPRSRARLIEWASMGQGCARLGADAGGCNTPAGVQGRRQKS